MRSLPLFYLFLTILLLAGCATTSLEPSPTVTPTVAAVSSCATPRRVIVGLDRSGSYSLVETGLEAAARIIERSACPDDTWFLRWIEADSYPTTAAIRTITFTSLPPRPQTAKSPIERARYFQDLSHWQASLRAFSTQKKTAGGQLRQDAVTTSELTDIVGFLMKADELLANTPAGYQQVVILATDLEDNVGLTGSFDLHGAAVLILAFEGSSAERTRELRNQWEERLKAAHASQVMYRDATEPATDLEALRAVPSASFSYSTGGAP